MTSIAAALGNGRERPGSLSGLRQRCLTVANRDPEGLPRPLLHGQSNTSLSSGQQAAQLHIRQALELEALMTSHCNRKMTNIVEAHGSGRREAVCAAAAYVAVAMAPAAAAARDTKSSSCNPFNPSSASSSSYTSSLTTTCSSSSSCASSCCSSCSCASCPSCTAAPWRDYNTEVISKCDNENDIKYDRGSGDENRGEMQRQRPGIPQHSSQVGSFPLSQPMQAAVSVALSIVDKDAHSILSPSGTPPSSDFLAPPLASTVPIADSRSESNPQTVVPVPQPMGFRRMPRDPASGRRICFYFNHTGCTASTRCAYMHVKTDISTITPGAFHKPAVPSTPFSVGPPPPFPSHHLSSSSSYTYSGSEISNCPRHHHSSSFPVDANLPLLPAALPTNVSPGAPLSLSATPAYVMYYVGVPSSYSRALPSSYSPSLPHSYHGGAPPPLPMVLGGDGEVRMQGRGGTAQWYDHQMQPGQHAANAMDEEWAGGMMEVTGVDMQFHQQHAYYEQHYHYYPYQQMLQQDEHEVQDEQEEKRQ